MAISQLPISGMMDLDTPNEVWQKGRHGYARNLEFYGNAGNYKAQVKLGTTLHSNSFLPTAGVNNIIGGKYDAIHKRIIYFNYNSLGYNGIYIFNTLTETFQVLVQAYTNSSIDFLNFTATNPISSIDIIYGDPYSSSSDTGGDLLTFADSLGRPTKLNIDRYLAGVYTNISRDFIDLAKAPPVMPIKCTYENDNTVTVNNLLNSLYQFAYTFIYDDSEESVLSSGSITPLPAITFSAINTTDKTKSARISLYMETGDVDVKKIRIYGRQTKNGLTGGWFIIDTVDKSFFSIASNSIYRYIFKNDGIYITADPKFTVLLQDYVPQQVNTQALLDGNTMAYAGITEGYDYIKSNYTITKTNAAPTLFTINGVLFFAYQPINSNNVTIYLTGVGTNDGTTGLPTTLDAPPLNLTVRAKVGSTDTSFSITNSSGTNIASILSALQSAAVTAGWTAVSSTSNSITLSLTNVVLQSSYIYQQNDALTLNQEFAHYPNSSYSYGVVYFDSKGRTNGVITDVGANVNTLDYANSTINQISVYLYGFYPPSWASYYHLVRTNTLTYNKYLWWVSNGAYSNVGQYVANQYAYIGISNIYDYNQQLESADNVVNYGFSQGDRVKITGVYNVAGTLTSLSYDYEILNVVVNPMLNGLEQTGTFIQINYPTADISSTFKFDGSPDFQNYQILIYSLSEHSPATATTNSNVYYEIGQQYKIGYNPGTGKLYHMGNVGDDTVQLSDGDVFYRTRSVPTGATYYLPAGNYKFGSQFSTFLINFNNSSNAVTTSQYVIGQQSNNEAPGNNTPAMTPGEYPHYSDNALFNNTSSGSLSIRVRGQYVLTLAASLGSATTSGIYIKMVNSSGTEKVLKIVPEQKVTQVNTDYPYDFDATIQVPAGYKAFIIVSNLTQAPDFSGLPDLWISQFTLRLDVLTNISINVYDSSFSDTYKLITNNDSRVQIQDRTAQQQFNSTLFRFSNPYVTGSTINNINRFYPNNTDEFDKSYGSVVRMKQHARQLRIYQERKVGTVGVYSNFIKDVSGTGNLITTDAIITPNNIQYYDFDGGLGNQPMGLVSNGFVDYIPDPVKGVIWRLSQDGGVPISEMYKVQSWTGAYLPTFLKNNTYLYGGYCKIIGVWNTKKDHSSEYILCAQAGTTSYGDTLIFNEQDNAFRCFVDFNPDFMVCAENRLVTFSNGKLYIHDNATNYNTFYGNTYPASITMVCNDGQNAKKEFTGYGYNANAKWSAPYDGDVTTAIGQLSNIMTSDMNEEGEGMYYGSFWGADDGANGVIDGSKLKGVWASIKLSINTSAFTYIQGIFMRYLNSQKNF